MEVILIKDIENLGYANDIVNVKPGYANNYLIPQGYAKAATAAAKKILAENLKQRAHKDAKILADAQALAEKIANLPLVIAAKAEEGRIFGAITAADLAEALAAKGIEIDRKTIAVENIKTLGEYEAVAKIHRDVKATIKFTVNAEEKSPASVSIEKADRTDRPFSSDRPKERPPPHAPLLRGIRKYRSAKTKKSLPLQMAAAPDDEGGRVKLTQGESDHGEIHASEQCTVGNIAYQLRRKTLHDSPRI